MGGDWYDIVELPDGRIGIMVGDCVGHDLGAATVMGQLRSACRALLLQDASASQALIAMDRFASFVPGAECATVFCGILDPATGELQYSSAAHPPGIVVHPDGEIVLLEEARSLPLAIKPGGVRSEASYVLPPRSTLLLYTDGLVERQRRPLTNGIAAAGAALRDAAGASVEGLATHVMTSLSPAGGYEDDVALVLYHHPAPLDMSFSAESEQLASVRSRLRGWLQACDVGVSMAQDVLVAAGEAIANAIEHGHRGSPGALVRLRAVSTADQVRLTVSDRGRWRSASPGDRTLRGHGIALMKVLMQQVTIEPGPAGTTVDMYIRIGARLMATPLEVSVERDPDGVPVVIAVGEIDMSNALRFREALGVAFAEAEDGADAGGAGAGGVFVVDLSGVEYFDSAGINALYQHVSRVRLIATPLLVPVLTVAGGLGGYVGAGAVGVSWAACGCGPVAGVASGAASRGVGGALAAAGRAFMIAGSFGRYLAISARDHGDGLAAWRLGKWLRWVAAALIS